MTDIDVAAAILAADGWHELDDVDAGRELHAESFSTRSTTKRTLDADGVWIDGTFTKRATKGNVSEMVSVWHDADTPHALALLMEETKAWFDQSSFTFRVRFADNLETWTCPRPADYIEDYDQAYRFATTALLKVTVYRLPQLVIAAV